MEGRILLARNLDLSSGVRCLNMPKVYIVTMCYIYLKKLTCMVCYYNNCICIVIVPTYKLIRMDVYQRLLL